MINDRILLNNLIPLHQLFIILFTIGSICNIVLIVIYVYLKYENTLHFLYHPHCFSGECFLSDSGLEIIPEEEELESSFTEPNTLETAEEVLQPPPSPYSVKCVDARSSLDTTDHSILEEAVSSFITDGSPDHSADGKDEWQHIQEPKKIYRNNSQQLKIDTSLQVDQEMKLKEKQKHEKWKAELSHQAAGFLTIKSVEEQLNEGCAKPVDAPTVEDENGLLELVFR